MKKITLFLLLLSFNSVAGFSQDFPSGSYTHTCTQACMITDKTMGAVCPDGAGTQCYYSSIKNVWGCDDIANNNGALSCGQTTENSQIVECGVCPPACGDAHCTNPQTLPPSAISRNPSMPHRGASVR